MSEAKSKPGTGLSLALDYGPLVVFFLAYKLTNVFIGTAVFMAAITIAVIVSKLKLGRVSPMLWLSAILIVAFGALTIWFHDPKFIQLKPTIIYTGLGALLLVGFAMGRPLLRYVLEAGFEGLNDRGWMVLSRNWGLFFIGMAVVNEIMVRNLSFDTWLALKVWALVPLSMAFGMAHIPYMMKNGLATDPPIPPAS
ncbi:MAG: septation protein IspZ [Sphingomonadales bacterium]